MTDKRIRIILDSKSAEANAKKLDGAVVGVGKSADRTAFAMNKLAAAIGAAISVSAIVSYVDAWTKVENQLKRTTTSSDELLKVSNDLLKVANDTRASLDTTADLYTSLTVSTKNLGVSQQDVIGVTKTINNLFLESGKGAAETAGAVRQLGQALESGALRGDEFNSVAEGAPGILRAIEAQTGLTRGELRKLAEQGEITADLIVTSLRNYSDEAQKAADKTTKTFEQSTTIARNNATAFIGASQALGDAVRLAGDGLVVISENLDKLAFAAGAAAAIYVARLIPAAVASGAAFATGTFEAIRYQAALARMAGVSTTAAAAQTALAGAARAANGAMALLGGPLGVIFLAASALVYFTSQADSAKKATDALSISTEGLTKNQAAAAKLTISDAIDAQNEKLEQLNGNVKLYQGRLKAISDLGGENSEAFAETNRKLTEAKGRYDEVSKSLNQLKDKYIELNNIQAGIQYLSPSAASGVLSSSSPASSEVAPTESPSAPVGISSGAQEIENARSVTEALKLELSTRLQISQAYRDAQSLQGGNQYDYEIALLNAREKEETALAEKRFAEDAQRRQEQQRQALDDELLTAEERFYIGQYYDEQEKTAAQLKQEELTAIEEKAKNDRIAIAQAERQAKIDLMFSSASAGVALLQAFGSKSEKKQKQLAKVGIAVDTARGIAAGVRLGWPMAIPAVAYAIATGKMAMDRLNGSGSGGGGGISAPNISESQSVNTNASTAEQAPQTKRIYDLRGVKADDKISVAAFKQLLEDDGAVVVLENARDDAARRGTIGVTAR